jgi:hypothetical protein
LNWEKRLEIVGIDFANILRFFTVKAEHVISDRIALIDLSIIARMNDILAVLCQVLFVDFFISV